MLNQPETSEKGPKRGQKIMPKERPIQARSRRGNRVYRSQSKHKGKVRFADSYTFAVKKDGQRLRLNLGRDLEEAKKMADQIQAFLLVPSHSLEDLFNHPDFEENLRVPRRFRRRKLEENLIAPAEKAVPTVEEILRRYEANAVQLSPTTVRNNSNSLRYLGARILGLKTLGRDASDRARKRWREKTGGMSIADFTFTALETVRSDMLRAVGSDGIARGKAATTLNSHFRCARSVFSERMMAFYTDFELPDPLPFRQIKPLREPSRRYVSEIDISSVIKSARNRFWDGVLEDDEKRERDAYLAKWDGRRIGGAKSEEDLILEDKGRFLSLLLILACGLRPKELIRLTWDQVDFDRRKINVAVTSYDTPKARSSESYVDVSESVMGYLHEFRPLCEIPPFVIPAVRRFETEPEKPGQSFFKPLCRWLRGHGVDCDHPLYVFRKEAGSIIYEETDSYDRAADFLRNDPRIAREHYVGRKGRLEIQVPGLESAA